MGGAPPAEVSPRAGDCRFASSSNRHSYASPSGVAGTIAFNDAATGGAERGTLSVKVIGADGALVGGLTGRAWGGLCEIELLWVREDSRTHGIPGGHAAVHMYKPLTEQARFDS